MITFEMAERANDYIRDHAEEYADAVSNRENKDEGLKILEATLMNEVDGAEHIKKAFARSHVSYQKMVNDRKIERRIEIKLKMEFAAAQDKISLWQSYNKTHGMVV